MTEKDQEVLTAFAAALRDRLPGARVWAFGSRTTGRSTEESDLDVCVVVDELDDATDQEITRAAWAVGFENDLVISTVSFSREEFERGPCAHSGLVRTVLREGVPA